MFDVNSSQRAAIVESFIMRQNRKCQDEQDQENQQKNVTNGRVDTAALLPEKMRHIKGMVSYFDLKRLFYTHKYHYSPT